MQHLLAPLRTMPVRFAAAVSAMKEELQRQRQGPKWVASVCVRMQQLPCEHADEPLPHSTTQVWYCGFRLAGAIAGTHHCWLCW